MARTFTEKVGMLQALLSMMEETSIRAKLASKGFDVVPHSERLSAKLKLVTSLNAEQERLRVEYNRKTAELNGILADSDMDASGVIDALCGILGKSSKEARNLQKIRSRIRVPRTNADDAPPSPADKKAA
jgi:hypothetical protein